MVVTSFDPINGRGLELARIVLIATSTLWSTICFVSFLLMVLALQ